jgi:hypothetical protein
MVHMELLVVHMTKMTVRAVMTRPYMVLSGCARIYSSQSGQPLSSLPSHSLPLTLCLSVSRHCPARAASRCHCPVPG